MLSGYDNYALWLPTENRGTREARAVDKDTEPSAGIVDRSHLFLPELIKISRKAAENRMGVNLLLTVAMQCGAHVICLIKCRYFM